MLQHLLKLSERSEPGFAAETIRWQVDLDAAGGVSGVLPLGSDRKGVRHARVPKMDGTKMNVGGRAHFLVESVGVVSLLSPEDNDERAREKARKRHDYFFRLIGDCAKICPSLGALAKSSGDEAWVSALRGRLAELGAKPNERLKFTLAGVDPLEDEEILEWWRAWRRRDSTGGSQSNGGEMVDFLTGEIAAAAATHPKVRGLGGVGGLSTGDVMAGFDKEAFQSYGLDQSANAAMSEATARRYVDGLNELLARRAKRLAGALVAFWFKERVPEADDPLSWILDPPEAQEASAISRAKELLESIRAGQRPELGRNVYYALTLSGASGRVMTRQWMEGSFPDLTRHIFRWFEDLQIAGLSGRPAREPKLESIVTCMLKPKTRSQKYDDWVRPLGSVRSALLRSAITGTAIPRQALDRVALLLPPFIAGKEVNDALHEKASASVGLTLSTLYARMGLLKAYFIRKGVAGMTAFLNEEHPEPAYHCGRLLAALSGLQRAALGDVGAGVVQRYYAGAAQRPAMIFGDLVRNSNNHLHKLQPGLARWFEGRIGKIAGRLGEFPRTLDLEGQSLFALGYYHQLVSDREKKATDAETAVQEA